MTLPILLEVEKLHGRRQSSVLCRDDHRRWDIDSTHNWRIPNVSLQRRR